MPHLAHRAEHQSIILIRDFCRRTPRRGKELPLAGWRVELIVLVQVRRAGMIERRARPLNMPHLAHFFVRHAVEERAKLAHLVPDLLVIVILHRVAHLGGEQADDLPVALNVAAGLNGFTKTLEPAIGAGKNAAVFAPGGGGEQNVRHFSRFGHKDVLNHHEVEGVKPAADQAKIGLRLERIFPHDVVGLDLALQRKVRHLGNARPDAIVHLSHVNPPGVGELLSDRRVGDVLIAGEHIGQNAHIAGALNIVLPAHRPDADGRAAKVTRQQRQA